MNVGARVSNWRQAAGSVERKAGLRRLESRGTGPVGTLLLALPMPVLALVGSAIDVSALSQVGALGTLALAVFSPMAGLAALAFIAPAKPLLVLPPPGFTAFLVVAILAGWVFSLPISRPRLSIGIIVLLVVGVALYAFTQQLPDMLTGYSTSEGRAIGFKFFQYAAALGTAAAAGLVLQRRDPRGVLAAAIAGAVGVSLLALVTFDNPLPTGPVANLVPEPDEGARATGSFGNPNYFGFFMASAAVLLLALYRFCYGRLLRLMLAAISALLIVALVLSLSRGAIIAFVAGLLTLAFLRSRRTGVLAVAILLLAVLVAYPIFVELRLTVLTGDADGTAAGAMASSDAGRFDAVLSGPLIWLTSPVFGIGFGRYAFESGSVIGNDGLVAHNWYMTVLAEQGVVGTIIWVLLLVSVLIALRQRLDPMRTIGISALATTVTGFMFLQSPTAFQTAALPAIVIAAGLVASWPEGPTPASTERLPARWVPRGAASQLAPAEGRQIADRGGAAVGNVQAETRQH